MLHCAVCDDDKSVAGILQGMLNRYSSELDCSAFLNPLELLSAIRRGQRFDLYILDIIMPELMGIDLAREIRQADGDCVIIFLTSSDEFHKDAFDVEALHYLDKPVDQVKLYQTLNRAMRYIGNKKDDLLPIRTKTGIHAIDINRIVYVESYRHVLTFYFKEGSPVETLDSSLSLEKLTESLRFPPFCTPYRGFILNMGHVDCLNRFQFSMTTGAVIPIPQKSFSKVRQQYADYLLTLHDRR